MLSEKRKNMRVSYGVLNFNQNVKCSYKIGSAWDICEIVDLSKDGVCVRLRQSLFENDQVELRLESKDNFLCTEGRVAHANGMKVGIKFANYNPVVETFLDEIFLENLKNRRTLQNTFSYSGNL